MNERISSIGASGADIFAQEITKNDTSNNVGLQESLSSVFKDFAKNYADSKEAKSVSSSSDDEQISSFINSFKEGFEKYNNPENEQFLTAYNYVMENNLFDENNTLLHDTLANLGSKEQTIIQMTQQEFDTVINNIGKDKEITVDSDRNNCLSNIIWNNYGVGMGDPTNKNPKYEKLTNVLVAANPQIYDPEVSSFKRGNIYRDAKRPEGVSIIPGEKFNLPNKVAVDNFLDGKTGVVVSGNYCYCQDEEGSYKRIPLEEAQIKVKQGEIKETIPEKQDTTPEAVVEANDKSAEAESAQIPEIQEVTIQISQEEADFLQSTELNNTEDNKLVFGAENGGFLNVVLQAFPGTVPYSDDYNEKAQLIMAANPQIYGDNSGRKELYGHEGDKSYRILYIGDELAIPAVDIEKPAATTKDGANVYVSGGNYYIKQTDGTYNKIPADKVTIKTEAGKSKPRVTAEEKVQEENTSMKMDPTAQSMYDEIMKGNLNTVDISGLSQEQLDSLIYNVTSAAENRQVNSSLCAMFLHKISEQKNQ